MLIFFHIFILKPWLFIRGQLLGTVRKIAIVSKLTLTIRRIVSTKDSFDEVSFPFEHVGGTHAGHASHLSHTSHAAHLAGHHSHRVFGAELSRTVGVLAVVAKVAMAFFRDVFAHLGFVVPRSYKKEKGPKLEFDDIFAKKCRM